MRTVRYTRRPFLGKLITMTPGSWRNSRRTVSSLTFRRSATSATVNTTSGTEFVPTTADVQDVPDHIATLEREIGDLEQLRAQLTRDEVSPDLESTDRWGDSYGPGYTRLRVQVDGLALHKDLKETLRDEQMWLARAQHTMREVRRWREIESQRVWSPVLWRWWVAVTFSLISTWLAGAGYAWMTELARAEGFTRGAALRGLLGL
jgi:hypothetical protein